MVQQKILQDEEAMGKSRGRLGTKIHAAVDALGTPVRFILTAGLHSEIRQSSPLIAGFSANYVMADKGYDADAFVVEIQSTGATVVIPPRTNPKHQETMISFYTVKEIWWSACFNSKNTIAVLPLVTNG